MTTIAWDCAEVESGMLYVTKTATNHSNYACRYLIESKLTLPLNEA